MGEVIIVSKTNKRVVCIGERYEHSTKIHPTRNCADPKCYFCTFHKGQHWTKDWIKCNCPIDIFPGDKLQVRRVFTIEKIRKYKR